MSTTGQLERRSQKATGKRVQTVLRVADEGRYAGDILLDANNRVWRHARTIPSDVVLRVLLSYTRESEVSGELVRQRDGRTYQWFVVGALADGEGEGNEINSDDSEIDFRVAG